MPHPGIIMTEGRGNVCPESEISCRIAISFHVEENDTVASVVRRIS